MDSEESQKLIQAATNSQIDAPQTASSKNQDSQAILDDDIKKSNKKKYIFWGVGIGVFVIALTIILIFALKKKDNPPQPPSPGDGPHFNPYRVLSYDSSSNTYKLSRWTNL